MGSETLLKISIRKKRVYSFYRVYLSSLFLSHLKCLRFFFFFNSTLKQVVSTQSFSKFPFSKGLLKTTFHPFSWIMRRLQLSPWVGPRVRHWNSAERFIFLPREGGWKKKINSPLKSSLSSYGGLFPTELKSVREFGLSVPPPMATKGVIGLMGGVRYGFTDTHKNGSAEENEHSLNDGSPIAT